MANNLPSLQTEIFNVLANTANLDATTKQKVRDRFVSAYPGVLSKFLADNTLTDTAANRGKFVAFCTMEYWKDIFRGESQKEQAAAISPETLA
jgi:hypothetical protein